MHLKRLEIAGYRSFSPHAPFVLDDLGRMNVLLGPNGVGKSNVGRLASCVCHLLKSTLAGGDLTYDRPALLMADLLPADSWLLKGDPITATFSVDAHHLPSILKCPPTWIGPGATLNLAFDARQQAEGQWAQWLASFQPRAATGEHFFDPKASVGDRPDVLGKTLKYQAAGREDRAGPQHIALGVCELISRRWLHVHALRHPTAADSLGTRTRAELAKLFTTEQHARRWQEVRHKLGGWTSALLAEPVRLDVLDPDFRITRRRPDGAALPLLLQESGDGVAQYLYLLAGLLLHPEDPAVVFIDEPEAHLHPGATLELLRIIDQELPHVQAIIATHSPAVVDALAPDWRFWRVDRDETGASRAERVQTQARRIAALDALGVHASQIFMARTVVWVEGPSDVVYYRALLAEVDPSLVAGRDYAFALFGGSNGTHFAVDGGDNLDEVIVDVLRLAQHNVFIHDKDSKKASADRVDRWKNQIATAELEGGAFATPGLEVENLVLPQVLLEAARETVTAVTADGRRVEVAFGDDVELGLHTPFATALAAACHGDPATTRLQESVAAQLHHKKHQLAREVTAIAAARRKDGNSESVFRPEALTWAKTVLEAIRQ